MIRELLGVLNGRVLLAGLGLAVFTLLALALGVWLSRPPLVLESAPAQVTVIPAPTATATPTVTPAVTPTATIDVPPSPPPGVIGIGAFVQVSGTGGDGLRMRNQPGLSGTVLFLGIDNEVFQVIDGPVEQDGYTWWHLQAPYDADVRGWAVSNFLSIAQNP